MQRSRADLSTTGFMRMKDGAISTLKLRFSLMVVADRSSTVALIQCAFMLISCERAGAKERVPVRGMRKVMG